MKLNTSRFDFRFIAILFFIAVVITANAALFVYHNHNREIIKNGYINELSDEIVVILGVYSDMSNMIYDLHINKDSVKKIFASAVKSRNLKQKDLYRKKLFNKLNVLYQEVLQYNFRQLHFHEKDNKSFLRFHRPGKYGDDLTGIRYSVELVNRKRKSAAGFEEGRIFNGYRFVYPLSYAKEHIGSVEISISMRTVLDQLRKKFNKRGQLIIRRDLVEGKVFAAELGNYDPWPVNENYMIDKAVSRGGDVLKASDVKNLQQTADFLNSPGGQGMARCFEVLLNNGPSIITFIPIKNISGENAAFVYTISDNERLRSQDRNFFFVFTAFITLMVFLIIFAFYYKLSQNKILKMAARDSLTGAFNRGMIFKIMNAEYERYKRYKKSFSVVMIDLDHFKVVNDTYGHSAGDRVLVLSSAIINDNIRSTDFFGRYGGEEFIILLPETSANGAAVIAENLRDLIASNDFSPAESITISCGVAEIMDSAETLEDIISRADSNLYRAKKLGRNRVVV